MHEVDAVVIGGGFFGCCLARHLRAGMDRVLLVEAGRELMGRASRVNQARVHAGFHYPRSFRTAVRSHQLMRRFEADFGGAVVDGFEMAYAIARVGSKVSASRFAKTYEAIGAELRPAPAQVRRLFDWGLVEEVFMCREPAFDWRTLRDVLARDLGSSGVAVMCGRRALRVEDRGTHAELALDGGDTVRAPWVFNVAYANVNAIPKASGLDLVPVKHELAEVALVEPPCELAGLGVTVMDGPFFSTMPFPAEAAYSLTHVRYTPHYSWEDAPGSPSADEMASQLGFATRYRHMVQDARRYVPALEGLQYRGSLVDVKTVAVRNEDDDGRPVLLHRHAGAPRLVSVLGAKLDNVYDVFQEVRVVLGPELKASFGLDLTLP